MNNDLKKSFFASFFGDSDPAFEDEGKLKETVGQDSYPASNSLADTPVGELPKPPAASQAEIPSLNDIVSHARTRKEQLAAAPQVQNEAPPPAPLLPSPPTDVEALQLLAVLNEHEEKPPRKKRPSLGRDQQIMTRLTSQELDRFHAQVRRSGRSQGEYLREMALYGRIELANVASAPYPEFEKLDDLRADLGRVGGLLKSTIKPNEGSGNISREEWEQVFASIRDIEHLTAEIRQVLAKLGRMRK